MELKGIVVWKDQKNDWVVVEKGSEKISEKGRETGVWQPQEVLNRELWEESDTRMKYVSGRYWNLCQKYDSGVRN